MSNKKDNFTKLFDYFNGEEEDSEEEIENYQQNYNTMIQAKKTLENEGTKNNNNYLVEQDQIITELYSDYEEEDDDNNNVFYYKEKKSVRGNGDENDFNG